MKRFLVCLVLIFTLLFNVFAGNNKKAHKELRAEFEKYELLPELKSRGFDLKKLDKIDDWEEMKNYLEQFFIDENGMPLDNHVWISSNYTDKAKVRSQMHIDFSDEYGSKDELLNKGYKEDEIFYYPYFNGEWHEDGYRVGKKYMGDRIYMEDNNQHGGSYFVNSENALLVGFDYFYNDQNETIYEEISKSNKEYLILDLSYNGGGSQSSYDDLVRAIKILKPKEIFIMISGVTVSMAEYCTSYLEKDSGIKITIIGYPTCGAYSACTGERKNISFDDFELTIGLGPKAYYNIPSLIEGIGITPDYYTENSFESLEVIKHLINDSELSLPSNY